MDQVPYSCSLCNFRCQDKETLIKHIKQYRPHREAVQKRGGVDHSTVLNRSANPRYVNDSDLEVLTKEESLRRFRKEDPFEDDESIFDEEDEADLMLPGWAREKPVNFDSLEHVSTVTPAYVARPLPISVTASATPSQPTIITTTSSQFLPRMEVKTSQPMIRATTPTNFETINYSDLLPSPNKKNTSTLGQIRSTNQLSTPVLQINTPLLDEKSTPGFEDILPQLIGAANSSDPLFMESQDPGCNLPNSAPRANLKRDATTSMPEMEAKKPREETVIPVPAPVVNFSPLVEALEKSTKAIVDAIDRNSRAVRCQDQTLSQILSGLNRIERTFDRKMEQYIGAEKTKEKGKENRPPVKSTVTKVNDKRK